MQKKDRIIKYNKDIAKFSKDKYDNAKEREKAANEDARNYKKIIKGSKWVNDTLSASPDEIEPYLQNDNVVSFRLLSNYLKDNLDADIIESADYTVSGVTMSFSGSAQLTSAISDFISDPENEIHRDWVQTSKATFKEVVDIDAIKLSNKSLIEDLLPELSTLYEETIDHYEKFEVKTLTDNTAALSMRTFLYKLKGEFYKYSNQISGSSLTDTQKQEIKSIRNSDASKKRQEWQVATVKMVKELPTNLGESLKNEFDNHRNITSRLSGIGKIRSLNDKLEDIYTLFLAHIGAVLGYCDEKHFK